MLRFDISPTVPKKTVSRLHRWGQRAWQRHRKTHGTVAVRVRWQDSRRRALHIRATLVLAAPARTRVLLDAFMLPQDDLDRIEERCGVMAALRDDALASPAINVGTIADLQAVNIYDYPDGTLAWVSGHQCFYSLSHGARDWRQL